MTATADELVIELLADPNVLTDPYPYYRRLREAHPAFVSDLSGMLVLSRFADCEEAFRSRSLGSGETEGQMVMSDATPATLERAYQQVGRSMLFVNPPDHTRLRRLVSRDFTPSRIAAMRPQVERLTQGYVDDLAERVAGGQPADVISTLALPLPVAVIGELLGVPEADRPRFMPLIRALTALLEPAPSEAALQAAIAAQDQATTYILELIDYRRREPGDDLLSALAQARGDDRLSDEEVVANSLLLFGAGFETTTNLIGNGLLALLRHPDQLAALRADPSLVPNAVEELLRYDAPVQMDGRVALEPTEVAGFDLKPGQMVLILIGAANHDPDRFADPDSLDVTRREPTALSFAAGIHYCLGAALARLEGDAVFTALFERFPRLELAGPTPHRVSFTLRGLESLPVIAPGG